MNNNITTEWISLKPGGYDLAKNKPYLTFCVASFEEKHEGHALHPLCFTIHLVCAIMI